MCKCFQAEQLVDQQILIDRLRRDLMTFQSAISGATVGAGASGNLGKRPLSVPLVRHSCGLRPARKVGSLSGLFCMCDTLLVPLVSFIVINTTQCYYIHLHVHAHTHNVYHSSAYVSFCPPLCL